MQGIGKIGDIDLYCASNYKLLNAVFVGEKAKVYIQDCTDLSPGDVKNF